MHIPLFLVCLFPVKQEFQLSTNIHQVPQTVKYDNAINVVFINYVQPVNFHGGAFNSEYDFDILILSKI